MSALSQLKLVSSRKPKHIPAIQLRRNKLSSRLWEQIELAKSQITGTPFIVKKSRSVVDRETGFRKHIELPKRIKPWWYVAENGKMCVSIKYGSWVIDLVKGKPSVEVSSPEDLIKTLETIKLAVESGELDQQIELASSSLRKGFEH